MSNYNPLNERLGGIDPVTGAYNRAGVTDLKELLVRDSSSADIIAVLEEIKVNTDPLDATLQTKLSELITQVKNSGDDLEVEVVKINATLLNEIKPQLVALVTQATAINANTDQLEAITTVTANNTTELVSRVYNNNTEVMVEAGDSYAVEKQHEVRITVLPTDPLNFVGNEFAEINGIKVFVNTSAITFTATTILANVIKVVANDTRVYITMVGA